MKVAALLLLQLFVFLSQTAVGIDPKQIHDSTKAYVKRTITQRASDDGSGSDLSATSDLGGDNLLRSFYFNIKPGGKVSGPPDRLFDWDVSCKDPTQRKKIWDAYKMAIQLAEEAEAQLRKLATELPNKPPTNVPQPDNQNWIAQHDPA